MSSGLMLEDIIKNAFAYISQNKQRVQWKRIFFQNPGLYNFLVQRIYARCYWKKIIADTKKTLRSHHFIEIEKFGEYLSGILSINIDEVDLEKKQNQFIIEISNFNNKHIIWCNNKPISNIPEEPRVTYHPWNQLNSWMVKINQEVMSTLHSKSFYIYLF